MSLEVCLRTRTKTGRFKAVRSFDSIKDFFNTLVPRVDTIEPMKTTWFDRAFNTKRHLLNRKIAEINRIAEAQENIKQSLVERANTLFSQE